MASRSAENAAFTDEILFQKPIRAPWYRWPLVAFMTALLGAGLWWYSSNFFRPEPLDLENVLLWVGLGALVGLAVLIRDDVAVVAVALLLTSLTLVGVFFEVAYLSELARFDGTWLTLGILGVLSLRGVIPGRTLPPEV